MTKAKGSPGRGWVTRQQLADLRDVDIGQMDRADRPLLSEADEKRIGKVVWIYFPAMKAAWEKKAREDAAKVSVPGDPLMSGPETPSLEELRKHNARIAKVKADEAERVSVPMTELRAGLAAAFLSLRTTVEDAERHFGGAVGKLLREGLDDAIGAAERAMSAFGEGCDKTDAGTAGAGEAAPVANDAGVRGAGGSDSERPV